MAKYTVTISKVQDDLYRVVERDDNAEKLSDLKRRARKARYEIAKENGLLLVQSDLACKTRDYVILGADGSLVHQS